MVRKTVLIDEELVQQLSALSKKEDRDFSGSLRHVLCVSDSRLLEKQRQAPNVGSFLCPSVFLLLHQRVWRYFPNSKCNTVFPL